MATKRRTKNEKKSPINFIKSGVATINNMVFENTDNLVDGLVNTSEQWQTVLAKSLKKGTTLLGKQQDVVFTGLEVLKNQYSYSYKRITNLLNINVSGYDQKELKEKSPVAKVKTAVKVKVKKAATKKVKAKPVAKVATKPAAKVATKTVVKPVAKVTTKTVVKPVAKVASKPATKIADLTAINGIGPKLQTILKKAGIANLEQMASATQTQLNKIMTDAGTGYQKYDTSDWAKQAKAVIAKNSK